MSDASPNKPTESLEEKIEEKIEQKVEAKLEQKVEEKARHQAGRRAAAGSLRRRPTRRSRSRRRRRRRSSRRRRDGRSRVPPAPTTSAPQAIAEQTAAIPAAPTQGQIHSHQSERGADVENEDRGTAGAQQTLSGDGAIAPRTGVAQVFFSLDRQGRVVEAGSCVHPARTSLDEEALALLRRAQPFPPPPREFAGDHVDFDRADPLHAQVTFADLKR